MSMLSEQADRLRLTADYISEHGVTSGDVNSKNTQSLMGEYRDKIVLQAMLVGDKYLMYEVVNKEDFESYEEGETI